MKTGIIGAGNIGGNLARRLTELGHQVAVANSRGPDTLRVSHELALTDAIDGYEHFDKRDDGWTKVLLHP